MPKYIKSHSNYVIKKRHQDVSDGRIWERDITTIGSVNQFSPSQVPIYKSSNFIITVRDDGRASNQYNSTKWESNGDSDVWTLDNLSGLVSLDSDENDLKIVLKNDYYDFCDFAYYGSLSEMFRASINDVVTRFPGELCGTNERAYYTSSITVDFNKIEESIQLGDHVVEHGSCPSVQIIGNVTTICEDSTTEVKVVDKYVDNPFSIDMHSPKRPFNTNVLKFFADNGFENYEIIEGSGDEGAPITDWISRNFVKVIKDEYVLDAIYGRDPFYREYLKPKVLQKYFDQLDNEVWWLENNNGEIVEKSIDSNGEELSGSAGYDDLVNSFLNGDIRKKFDEYNRFCIEKVKRLSSDCQCAEYSRFEDFYDEYDACKTRVDELNETEPDENIEYYVRNGAMCCEVECYIDTPCKGYKAASVTAKTSSSTHVIGAWVGDNDEIVYMSSDMVQVDSGENITSVTHIRPKKEFIDKFYDECDHFEKIILSRKTTPRYKSTFSVIKENERGYYREMESFIFPTTYGGYNLDVSEYGLSDFSMRLSEIGLYYDELFTDNLYRSMTHEAIKNFDWTFTREFNIGDEDEYVHGGEKIQKALRVFAREFDEILLYINNIKNMNRITYDERNNLPDYFLIDEVEKKGWDGMLVYPYDLDEYCYDANGEKKSISAYTETEQLNNKLNDDGNKIYRNFSQNAQKKIKPYSKSLIDDFPNGYFVVCDGDGGGVAPCEYSGGSDIYFYQEADGSTYFDSSVGRIKNRVKSFSDEREYTYQEANNSFLRNLVINSNHIWRHKGTLEGVEMLLSLFGLRSQRWIDRLPKHVQDCKGYVADYEISEYSSFTNRIEEKWDAVHQMYRIDWINSTKTIVYDYRSMSNYSQYGDMPDYISYQGLPVSYRDEYILSNKENHKPYIKVSPLDFDNPQEITSDVSQAFKRIDTNNGPVVRRYLYPNFEKFEQIDGGVYFQMNGGWMAKTLSNSDGGKYNFQFDVDDNIAYTCYVPKGSVSQEGDVSDNHPIYKETIRNIKRVDNLQELISTPFDTLSEGDIIYVSMIEGDIAIIDNEVYKINYEYVDENVTLRYVTLRKSGGFIQVGESKFFDSTIVVYTWQNGDEGIEFVKTMYNLEDKSDGYEVKAYIDNNDKFVCQATMDDGVYTIDSFVIFDNTATSASTNYFIIDDPYYSDRIASDEMPTGWRRLYEGDAEYIRINTIKNYYDGNNPHNGNMVYDGGHEYFTYFKRLFKHAMDNDLFDERCYEAFYYNFDEEIGKYGFKGLIEDNEMIKQYFPCISGLTDTKIHYFGNYYKKTPNNTKTDCIKVMWYGENEDKMIQQEASYKKLDPDITLESYILNNKNHMIGGTPYPSGANVDEVTNQVMNNKRLSIKFNLHNKWHTKQGQCEVKYLDSVVLPYLEQMIPSSAIVDIEYVYSKP